MKAKCSCGFSVTILLAALGLPAVAAAQGQDSIRPVELNPLVVTAERVQAPLVTSTAAVAQVSGEELRALPVRSVAEALASVPGLTFLDVEGTGFDPQVTLRGFYGGGEAEYVVVLLDGRPLNGLEAGLVDWDLLPLEAVESIEVVRGGASSLYGDAAVGGVINLVTARGRRGGSASLSGGELGTLRGSFTVAGDRASAFGAVRRSDGFREHAGRTALSAGGSLALVRGGTGELSLSTLQHWREYDEPGPLTAAELAGSRTSVHPFYRFDRTAERLHRLALDGRRDLARGAQASGFLAGELRALEATRTLPLSPDFADTKDRVLNTARLLGSAQVRWAEGMLPLPGGLLLGADWSAGRLDNEHYHVLFGDPAAYRAGNGRRSGLDATGEGARLAAAGFARYELHAAEALRLTVGGRVDWLRDTFEPRLDELPPPASDGPGTQLENTHVAFSPQAGMNLRWLRTATQEGNVFVNAGRSFKAPTMDQLFDQRTIPVPFEPYQLMLSNPGLEPARGVSYELGMYHRAGLVPNALAASISLAAYQLDMENELDVDLQTYRYVNIGRSRHRGLEAGVDLAGPRALGAFASYTLQDATFRNGAHAGNALKAIPRHALAAGVRAGSRAGLAGSVTARRAWGVYLDDANTVELPGYTRVDARASLDVGRVRLQAEVFNLFAATYSTTGYPDPAGSGVIYYYPAAGRMLQLGIATEW